MKDVGVMKDEDLMLEDIKDSLTLGGYISLTTESSRGWGMW